MTSPIETNNVVERLRRKEPCFPVHLGAFDGHGQTTVTHHVTTDGLRLVNPDGPEAADLIQSLSDRIDVLDAECERAWGSYRIAVDQAMTNGQALADLRASLTQGGNTNG